MKKLIFILCLCTHSMYGWSIFSYMPSFSMPHCIAAPLAAMWAYSHVTTQKAEMQTNNLPAEPHNNSSQKSRAHSLSLTPVDPQKLLGLAKIFYGLQQQHLQQATQHQPVLQEHLAYKKLAETIRHVEPELTNLRTQRERLLTSWLTRKTTLTEEDFERLRLITREEQELKDMGRTRIDTILGAHPGFVNALIPDTLKHFKQ